MKLIPLGTNGFFPSFGRQTACYAVALDKTLIILDAGSGLFRMAETDFKDWLKSFDKIHIFLSHYHLDHTFGFYAASQLFADKKVTVNSLEGRQVFSELVKLSYIPTKFDYQKNYSNFNFVAVSEGLYKIDGWSVAVKRQNHGGDMSLVYNFDFGLVYITDCEPTNDLPAFAHGAKLLLHEHYYTGDFIPNNNALEKYFKDGHMSSIGAALVAKMANVGKLGLIHHRPYFDNSILEKQLAQAKKIFHNTVLALDNQVIDF